MNIKTAYVAVIITDFIHSGNWWFIVNLIFSVLGLKLENSGKCKFINCIYIGMW